MMTAPFIEKQPGIINSNPKTNINRSDTRNKTKQFQVHRTAILKRNKPTMTATTKKNNWYRTAKTTINT